MLLTFAAAGWLAAATLAVLWWRAHGAGPEADADAGSGEAAARERTAAVAAERERIYNDLHDDLGAHLLQLVYEAPDPRQADLARAVLQDLRDVVSRSRGTPGNLEQVLSDIRTEATQRLAAVGASLRWEQPAGLPECALQPQHALHLYRIVREAITNALRHAHARRLRMRIRAAHGRLDVELTDDGASGPVDATAEGSGMRGMRARAGELQGDIVWLPGTEGGTKVLLSIPLGDGAG